MHILTNIDSLKELVKHFKREGKLIGFVPTMGALHEGHLSLVKQAQKECDIVVCSIFVNPTQFNDPNDFNNYPLTIEQDTNLLTKQNCDILFQPSVNEMYPKGLKTKSYDLNGIEKVLEGQKRPGHFDGVCTVVHRLFTIVEADYAYFGEKDFQQVAVIRQMVNTLPLNITIKSGSTIREKDGLAKSSRNSLLSPSQREKASLIYKTLTEVKSLYGTIKYNELKDMVKTKLETVEEMRLDYIEIADPITLNPLENQTKQTKAIALIAVFLGNIRLIDNLSLND